MPATYYHYFALDGTQQRKILTAKEFQTHTPCPIDGNYLFETGIQDSHFTEKTIYQCPCCNTTYHSLEADRLEHTKQVTIRAIIKKLADVRDQESRLSKILALAQSSPKDTPPKPLDFQAAKNVAEEKFRKAAFEIIAHSADHLN